MVLQRKQASSFKPDTSLEFDVWIGQTLAVYHDYPELNNFTTFSVSSKPSAAEVLMQGFEYDSDRQQKIVEDILAQLASGHALHDSRQIYFAKGLINCLKRRHNSNTLK